MASDAGVLIDLGYPLPVRVEKLRDGHRWATVVKLREETQRGWWVQLGSIPLGSGTHSIPYCWRRRVWVPKTIVQTGTRVGAEPVC